MTLTLPPGPAALSVRIERRGGLAGLRPCTEHAYADLTGGQRHALDALLAGAPGAAPRPPGADRFSYRIRVQHAGGGERLLDVSEDTMPSSLAQLVKPTLPR